MVGWPPKRGITVYCCIYITVCNKDLVTVEPNFGKYSCY